MKLAIMQPYFMPYIGYWQLLSAVDVFIVYDNIQFTKKGWINRNRFLQNGTDSVFTIPVRQDSVDLDIVRRSVAADFDRDKLLNRLEDSYRKAPCYQTVFPLLDCIVRAEHTNLFEYIHNSIRLTAEFLEIKTPIVISSAVAIDHSLRGQTKVLALCKAMGTETYINPIGGESLYSKATFQQHGVELKFLQTRPIVYPQYNGSFVENLSIIDVMMFNSKDVVRGLLSRYDLI